MKEKCPRPFYDYFEIVEKRLLPLFKRKNLNGQSIKAIADDIGLDNTGYLVLAALRMDYYILASEISISLISLVKENYPNEDMSMFVEFYNDIVFTLDRGDQKGLDYIKYINRQQKRFKVN